MGWQRWRRCFGIVKARLAIAFLVAIFFCQIVFGIYAHDLRVAREQAAMERSHA